MLDDKLTLIYDEPFRLAVLQLATVPPQQGSLLLREGFSVEFLRDAILATGWVRADGAQHFRLLSNVRVEFLCDVLRDMLQLFESPEEPGRDLREIETTLADYQREIGSNIEVPALALAWLDAVLREDLAEEARSAFRVWSEECIAVECEVHRQRRMVEVLQRYEDASLITPRLAASKSTQPISSISKSG